ncbi:hypothetical protein NKH77_11360 [Streptomyces sp. M19]
MTAKDEPARYPRPTVTAAEAAWVWRLLSSEAMAPDARPRPYGSPSSRAWRAPPAPATGTCCAAPSARSTWTRRG